MLFLPVMWAAALRSHGRSRTLCTLLFWHFCGLWDPACENVGVGLNFGDRAAWAGMLLLPSAWQAADGMQLGRLLFQGRFSFDRLT